MSSINMMGNNKNVWNMDDVWTTTTYAATVFLSSESDEWKDNSRFRSFCIIFLRIKKKQKKIASGFRSFVPPQCSVEKSLQEMQSFKYKHQAHRRNLNFFFLSKTVNTRIHIHTYVCKYELITEQKEKRKIQNQIKI